MPPTVCATLAMATVFPVHPIQTQHAQAVTLPFSEHYLDLAVSATLDITKPVFLYAVAATVPV